MSNDAPIIQGRIETRRTSDKRSITTVSDGQGWHLVYDDDGRQAYTVDPNGNRTATIRADENGRLQLPQDAVSRELRNSLEPEGMMTGDESWKHSAFSALGGLFSAIRTVAVGRNIEMRQGDLQSLSRAMQEQQRQQEQGHEQPASTAPHGSIEQLGDKFRAAAPATIKAEVRADGGLKSGTAEEAPAQNESAEALINRIRAERGEAPLGARSGDAEMLSGVEAQVDRHMEKWRAEQANQPAEQPDHGLGGTGIKRQISPETFRA